MRSKSELESLAARNGWKVGPLTSAQIRRMSSTEAEFHGTCNKKEFERACEEPKAKAASKANLEASKTQRMWADQATPEEIQGSLEEVQVFCIMFPQFRGDYIPNRTMLVDWLRERSMPVTARTLVNAFQSLGAQGKLLLNPAAIGIGKDSEVTGHKLASHPQLSTILEPAKTVEDQEKLAFGKMGADEYRKSVLKPLAEKQLGIEIPKAALLSFDRAWASFTSLHAEYLNSEENREKLADYLEGKNLDPTLNNLNTAYSALVDAGDLELNQGAIVSMSGKVGEAKNPLASTGVFEDASSLSRKINGMTSTEYSAWILNPTNRKAADAILTKSR